MSYRVVWRERIRNNLRAHMFVDYEQGFGLEAIPRAVTEIDRLLSQRPSEAGESREAKERVLIVAPLTVLYEVFEAEKVVLIYGAVLYPRRRA